ncbi:chromosome transmission fidelity protein 18 homolog isoform X2 [Phlebotomus papatasi]|uniref:chromosome transmission fidelity protein 18 homolog isoform X2 n=1 Tax=Phlebotomus papatasi TaxID=29031 RepID=UPI0024836216|nr:chromosome transmission fidelity protein 18 homolog isoform X2 [Phlebotomus papatasi]
MDYYPTEEEEYELMYGDELEMLDDDVAATPQNPAPKIAAKPTQPPKPTQEIFPDSPALSQISRIDQINRRLFDDSVSMPNASTPLVSGRVILNGNETPVAVGSRKRRLEGLYEENLFSPGWQMKQQQKKQRQEEDRDTRMIEQILEARKRTMEMVNPMKSSNLSRLEQLHRFKMQNLSYSLPNYPFQTLCRSDGERIYVRTHNEDFVQKAVDEVRIVGSFRESLLGDEKAKIWNEAREITLKRISGQENPPEVVEIQVNSVQGDLWVEKYRPKKYRDLLSDESTNRCLLQWLKMWDKVVFNRDIQQKVAPGKPLNTFNKQTGKFESTGGWRKTFRTRNNLLTDRDALGRPIQKIALLSGAPGLGKTTLAHVIAHHAGYNVLEVNASDDRTSEAFRQVLEDGTQMKSLLTKENRPNCLIFDEIDGAPATSIDLLIKFASDTMAPAQKGAKKGGKAQKNVLKRPIICICNDIYSPALRQLRQMALVVNFPPLNSERLAERLLSIALKEKVQTDFGALLSLAEKTGNDVRSCISMIQFFSATQKPLMLSDVLKGNIGQKDQHKGLFAIWATIFQSSQKLQTHKMLMIALRKGLGSTVRGIGEGCVMLLDTLPLIRRILSPSIRSVSLQLLTPKERSDLQHAVEVMADLGVKFVQVKGIDGAFKYQMEPDIELLSFFRSSEDIPLSYWTRQLVAREVDLENMRRAKPKVGEVSKKKHEAKTPNHLQSLQPKKVVGNVSKYKELVVKDFFGRVVKKQAPLSVKEGGIDGIVKSPIWYRFKEGYNNAVRKDITLSDFI